MSLFRRSFQNNDVPGLNTASLPDLIFTVLFFFMIVTQMRHDEVKVRLVQPNGTELTKLQQKSSAVYIYVGQRSTVNGQQPTDDDDYQIQINNDIVPLPEVSAYMKALTENMPVVDREKVIINLKADKEVPMALVKQIKEALKMADTRLIHYSANEKKGKD